MGRVEKALGKRLRGRRFREMTEEILEAQGKLRRMVSSRAWRAYLALEEMTGARDDAALAAAIRLAFRHGQRALLAEVVRHLRLD